MSKIKKEQAEQVDEESPKTLMRGTDARRAVEKPHEVMGVSTQIIADTRKGKAGEKSKP